MGKIEIYKSLECLEKEVFNTQGSRATDFWNASCKYTCSSFTILSVHCQAIWLTKQWTLCCRKYLFSLFKDPPPLWKLQSSFRPLLICFVFQNPIPLGNSYSFYGVGEYTLWIFPGTAVSPSTQAFIIVLIIMFQLFKISLLSSIVWDIILSQHDKFSYTL